MISFLTRAINLSVPLIFGSTGEIITEKSGHLNLGIPGVMYVGSISSIMGAFVYEQAAKDNFNPVLGMLIPIICMMIGSGLMGLIYCFLTVTLRANQNVTGLMLTTFGTGVGNYFGGKFMMLSGADVSSFSTRKTSMLFCKKLPFADDLGWFGELFLSYGVLMYLSIAVALVSAYILAKTRTGLKLRAVGENPATADAAGISVTRYRYLSTIIGSIIAGFGGLHYIMDKSYGIWSNNAFGDLGWLAVAIVIFALWKPDLAILGSFLFGIFLVLPTTINVSMSQMKLFEAMPYIVTIIVLVITSMRKKREFQPPEALGTNYFREER